MSKTTTHARVEDFVARAYPEAAVVHGWILDGAGPARFGWGARFATGRIYYLGRTAAEVLARAAQEVR